jgi:hypothetical protein
MQGRLESRTFLGCRGRGSFLGYRRRGCFSCGHCRGRKRCRRPEVVRQTKWTTQRSVDRAIHFASQCRGRQEWWVCWVSRQAVARAEAYPGHQDTRRKHGVSYVGFNAFKEARLSGSISSLIVSLPLLMFFASLVHLLSYHAAGVRIAIDSELLSRRRRRLCRERILPVARLSFSISAGRPAAVWL